VGKIKEPRDTRSEFASRHVLTRRSDLWSWREESNPQPAVYKPVLSLFHPITLQHQNQ